MVLALAFGFVVGLVVGARRALNLMLSQRAIRVTSARLAQFTADQMPTRSAADILAGRVKVRLGSTTYDLPVLARGPSKRWLEQLDERFAILALTLDQAGNDTPQIMALLTAHADSLYDMLLSYDQSGIRPGREEIDESATDAQILHAVLEVWRAVHPLVASMVATDPGETSGTSPAPTSPPPSPTAGGPITSSPASPTSS